MDYNPEEIVDAFNQVEKTMGSDWIGLTFDPCRGLWVAISIIDLGKTLKEVGKDLDGTKLINKIRDNYPNKILHVTAGNNVATPQFKLSDSLHELSHSLQVARLLAHYRRHSYTVEIEPELIVNGKKKFPDLRVKSDSKWVYVEVVCPSFSEENQEAYKALNQIASLGDQVRTNRVIEVYLYKDPSKQEIRHIIDTCKLLAQRDVQPQESNINDIAQIFTNPWNEERLPNFGPAIIEKRPILVVINFNFAHRRRDIVKMPFTDERDQKNSG